ERRPEQFLAQVVDFVGCVRARVHLIEDDAMRDRQPAAAVLHRPAEAGQPRRGQMLIPRPTLFEGFVFTPRSTQALERCEFANEIVFEPLPDLGPELLDLYHPCRLTYQAFALLREHR